MGQSTEELTTQIEQTRIQMASDVDALQDKVSPSAIVERRKEATRQRVGSMKERVMGAKDTVTSTPSDTATGAVGGVKDTAKSAVSGTQSQIQGSPLGAGLVAFGVGLVAASLLPASKVEADAAHQALQHAQPLVDDARHTAQQVVADAKDQATQVAQQVKDSAADSASTVKNEAASSADSVKSEAQSS